MEAVADGQMPGERPLNGQAEYDAALDELLVNARHTVCIFEWRIAGNYNTPQRHELLRRLLLASPNHRVHLVLHEAGNVVRDCPRLVNLLRQFSAGLSIHRTLPPARHVTDPFAIADDTRFVRRFHHEQPGGTASVGDLAATRTLLKRFEELRQASTPAVHATTIGL